LPIEFQKLRYCFIQMLLAVADRKLVCKTKEKLLERLHQAIFAFWGHCFLGWITLLTFRAMGCCFLDDFWSL
jgi:hypothetical protein